MDESSPLSPSRGGLGATSEELDKIDPFSFKPQFTLCDKILMFINAFWLLPIRVFFILIPSFIMGTLFLITGILFDSYDPDNPVPRSKWRRVYTDTFGPFFARMFMFAFGFHWIHYKGHPATAKEAPITILVPHSSFIDVFVGALYGIPAYVARYDMKNVFLFGTILTRVRTIFVKRDDTDSKIKAAQEIKRRADSDGVWPKVQLFPEGTTNNRKVVLAFKTGAFQPGLPVQPFLIKYKHRLGTTTWGRTGWNQILNLTYTLCQFHTGLELEYMDVYYPSEAEKADPQLYANNVRELVAKNLGAPCGHQSVEDNYFMSQGKKLGLPFTSGLVLYNKVTKECGIRFADIRTAMLRFASIDRNKDGWVTPEDMATFLSVPNDVCLQTLFWTTDKDAKERMSFKQYLYGFVGRAKPFLKDDAFLTSVFNFFDKDNDGLVSMRDISQVLPISRLPEVTESQVGRKRGGGKDTLRTDVHVPLDEEMGTGEEVSEAMNYGAFKVMLEANPEYLLLFHECQNAGLSSAATSNSGHSSSLSHSHNSHSDSPNSNHSQYGSTDVVIEVREEIPLT